MNVANLHREINFQNLSQKAIGKERSQHLYDSNGCNLQSERRTKQNFMIIAKILATKIEAPLAVITLPLLISLT